MTNTRLNAVIIEDDKANNENKYFTNIGSGFMHEDNNGLDLVLQAYPVNGKFSVFLPNETADELALPKETYYPVSIVESVKDEDGKYKNYYHRIGAAFAHGNHKGLSIELLATPILKDKTKLVIRTPKKDS